MSPAPLWLYRRQTKIPGNSLRQFSLPLGQLSRPTSQASDTRQLPLSCYEENVTTETHRYLQHLPSLHSIFSASIFHHTFPRGLQACPRHVCSLLHWPKREGFPLRTPHCSAFTFWSCYQDPGSLDLRTNQDPYLRCLRAESLESRDSLMNGGATG